MRDYTETFCPIDHIAIDVKDLASYVDFFEHVFGMQVYRTQGPENDPSSVWLDGGIQLLKVEDPSMDNGRYHHLAFQVASVDAILEKAKPYGSVPVPGKGRHWFMLPDGIKFELKEQKAKPSSL